MTVDRFRVLHHRLDVHPSISFQAPEKAALASRMTGDPARLFNVEQDRVVVAVETDFAHALHVSGAFAFAPETAGPAPRGSSTPASALCPTRRPARSPRRGRRPAIAPDRASPSCQWVAVKRQS